MSMFRQVISSLFGGDVSRAKVRRAVVKQVPVCDALEGRRLMNGAWSGGHGHVGAMGSAHIHHDHKHGGGKVGRDHLAMNANPQAAADFKTLRADMKTLETEVPADVTAQIKADKAVIDKAIGSLTPAQRQTARASINSGTPGTDPAAFVTANLQAANVPPAQINSIVSDFTNYRTTLQTVDPTLTAKIAADETALQNDLPAGAQSGHFGHSGMPGMGL